MAPPSSISMIFGGGSEDVKPSTQQAVPKRSHTFDEALELVGFGWAQISLVLLCGFAIMASINEAMGMSIILPASHCDLGLDPGEKGMVGGAIFLGVMTASYFCGYQADTRGRQLVLKYALIATSVCSVASSFANDFGSLMVLRFLTGLCISAPSATSFAYLGEFCSNRRRVQMLSFAAVMPSIGILYVAGVGWWILSYDWSFQLTESITFRPWRLLFILYTIPGLLAGIVMFFFPESPKFLLSQGREREALEVLEKLHRMNNGGDKKYEVIALRADEGEVIQVIQKGFLGVLKSMKDQTVPLIKMPHLIYFLVCCAHNISAFTIYGGLGLWFPQIMNTISMSGNSEGTQICSILQQGPSSENFLAECNDHVEQETFIYTLILGCFGTIYSSIMSIILGHFSGRTVMVFNMVVAGIAGILLQFVTNGYLLAVFFCVEIMFAGVCVPLVNGQAVSLFPTHVRGMAVSLINMIGRLSCFVASAVIGLLMARDCPLTFYFLSAMLFVSSALTFFLPRVEQK